MIMAWNPEWETRYAIAVLRLGEVFYHTMLRHKVARSGNPIEQNDEQCISFQEGWVKRIDDKVCLEERSPAENKSKRF